MTTGAVLCWGRNLRHQLGDGTKVSSLTPVPVIGLGGGTDTQSPVVTADVAGPLGGGPDGQNGWFVSAPKVSIVADDTASGGSGLSSVSLWCEPTIPHRSTSPTEDRFLPRFAWSFTVQSDGVYDVTCSATDMEGNVGSTTLHLKRDATAPSIRLTGPKVFQLNEPAVARPVANDQTSGRAGQPVCGPIDTSTVGTKTVECSASDHAGNTAVKSFTYRVE